jgi:hypothetical protein
VAVDAVGGPGQGLEAFRSDGLAAVLADPKGAGIDAAKGAFDLDEVEPFAFAHLLAALAFRDFGGRGRLSTVGDLRMFNLFGELQPESITLGFERAASLIHGVRLHGAHPTLLDEVVRANSRGAATAAGGSPLANVAHSSARSMAVSADWA